MARELGYIFLSVALGFTAGALLMTILHFIDVLG